MTNQLELFPATEARKRYAKPEFVEIMASVIEAITDACREHRQVVINVKQSHEVNRVAVDLRDLGYDVIIQHDPENQSSELTISWF